MNFLDDVISGQVVLPMVPRVIERVLAQMQKDDFSLNAIATEMEHDPVLSARVLRLANSSFFGGKRTMSSISEAVSMIGTTTLQTLVISCGAQAVFVDVPGVNLRQFWSTCAMSAASARQIATRLQLNKETAYSAGLLQAVGHLILCQCHRELALQERSSMSALWGAQLADRETTVFGINHAQVSALWVKKLGLPTSVVEAIEHSLNALDDDANHTLGRVVQMACNVGWAASRCENVADASAFIDTELVNALQLGSYLQGEDFATDFAELKELTNIAS